MVKYNNLNIEAVHDLRAVVNNNILTEIATKAGQITDEQIFNCYTGKGGLHGLEYTDYNCFYDYTEAKKEMEQGQFFTPFNLAEKITNIVSPDGTVLDPTCGVGIFCNFINEKDFTGVDIDSDSITVAKHLYPESKFEVYDLNYWKGGKYDYIITNPPFNLRWNDLTSQCFILEQAKEWLKAYGIFCAIVPEKYLKDEMYFKRDVSFINDNYNWLGQVNLPINAFKNYGVNFPTKVIFFQNIEGENYSNEYSTFEEIAERIKIAKQVKRDNFLKVVKSIPSDNDYSLSNGLREKNAGFEFQVKKLLFEIRVHNKGKNYDKSLSLIKEYQQQEKPFGMEWEEWEKIRLTEGRVLSRLRINAGFRNKKRSKGVSKPANTAQLKPFAEIVPSQEIKGYLDSFTFKNERGEFHLTDMQKNDVGRILMKPYGILNWEQGCGKTPAAFAVSEYRKCLNIVVAPAIAVNGTWKGFLELNNKTFQIVKKIKDIRTDVDYLLFSYSQLAAKKVLVRFIKKAIRNINVQLIADESDEMTNRSSKTYKAVRSAFSKCRYKLLTTGTTTRNNAAELYPQLELLYNNSLNLVDNCPVVMVDKKERGKDSRLVEVKNDNFGKRFHPYKGLQQFKRCFSPSKTTVFGIKKQDQDVYNYSELLKILNCTSLVRTLKEVVGEKCKIEHVSIQPSYEERLLQDKILEEFHAIYRNYFASTGSVRKESGLKIIRQLQLLIKSCSMPQSFIEYTGIGSTKKSKIMKMVSDIDDKICIGCMTKTAAGMYFNSIKDRFRDRDVFYIDGGVSFVKRKEIIKKFEATENGVLVCTQQSLRSSVNIPSCNHCIIESMSWNLPKMSQFSGRFSRFNSKYITKVYFVTYSPSIEDNLLALIMTKEKINKAVKFDSELDVFAENGLSESLLDSIMKREYDKESKKMKITWGMQKIS